MKRFIICCTFILGWTLIILQNSSASTFIFRTPEKIFIDAPLIIDARVQNVAFYVITNSPFGYAELSLTVSDMIKGACPSTIVMRRYGVRGENEYLFTNTTPTFHKGDRVVIALRKHKKGYYKFLGLYNGCFYIVNGLIKKTNISVVTFKSWIEEILNGTKQQFPPEVPCFNVESLRLHTQMLMNRVGLNKTSSSGSHLNGQFVAENQTWDTSKLPIKFYYNPSDSPESNSVVIDRINDAFDVWNNLSFSNLTFVEMSTSDLTSQGAVWNSTSVILWSENLNDNHLAEESKYPGLGGLNSIRGSDIVFNTDYSELWYFNSSPPGDRNENQVDFVDVLVHELGHTNALAHTNISSTIMYGNGYLNRTGPLRTLADGDKAGAVHQHPKTNFYGTLPHSIVLSATGSSFNITNTLIVPGGCTFEIESGKTVTLNGNLFYCQSSGKIINNGAVSGYIHYAQSGSDYKGFFPSSTDIQDIIGWSSSGWDIYIGSGEYNEILSMKPGVDLIGENYYNKPTINGTITFSNDDYAGIENLKVKNKITISYSDYVSLDNIISDHSNCYIESVGSEGEFNDLYFDQSQSKAFYGHDGGYSDFYSGSFEYNNNQAIYMHFFATADFTEPYFCNNNFDIYVTPFSYVWVYGNNSYFSSSTEGSTVSSGLVEWEDWYGCGMGKSLAKNGGNDHVTHVSSQEDSPDKQDYQQAMDKYRSIKYQLKEDREAGESLEPNQYESDYDEAIGDFKQVVEDYPTSFYADLSLDRISASHRALKEYKELADYIHSIVSDKKYEKLRPHALNTLIPSYVDQEEYQKAIDLSDQIIKEYPDDEIVVEKLYGKGLIYKYDLKDFDKAEEMFMTVIANYPDHMTAQSAKEELESMGVKYVEGELASTETSNELSVENYPNPFNPDTQIQFTLPEAGQVSVIIYNNLGQEVITLLHEERDKGKYTIQWNGKDRNGQQMVSGIYFYQIRFQNQLLNRKMLLVK